MFYPIYGHINRTVKEKTRKNIKSKLCKSMPTQNFYTIAKTGSLKNRRHQRDTSYQELMLRTVKGCTKLAGSRNKKLELNYKHFLLLFFVLGPLACFPSELIWNYGSYRQLVGLL
jgi:hypothetical protein